MANPANEHEVVVQIPDIGLDKEQLNSLKETFKNHMVATLEKAAANVRIIVIRIRCQTEV